MAALEYVMAEDSCARVPSTFCGTAGRSDLVILVSQEVSSPPIAPVPTESEPCLFAGNTVILSGIAGSVPGKEPKVVELKDVQAAARMEISSDGSSQKMK
jgi:hypothetical protein